jgi:hypothetical protein
VGLIAAWVDDVRVYIGCLFVDGACIGGVRVNAEQLPFVFCIELVMLEVLAILLSHSGVPVCV